MKQHELKRVEVVAGWEDWRCTECGRRFLVRWQPYNRYVLAEGEAGVLHVGHGDDNVMDSRDFAIHYRETDDSGDEPLVGPFADWAQENGIE